MTVETWVGVLVASVVILLLRDEFMEAQRWWKIEKRWRRS